MSTSLVAAEQRQRVIGIMVSLVVCLAAGSDTAGSIASISGLAGSLTLALSFYALIMFFLHLAQNLALIRPAVVRLWHAAILVCVTAAATWIVVLPHVSQSIQTVAVFCPLCVLAVLIAGPWHGLLPDFRKQPAQLLENEERSREDE